MVSFIDSHSYSSFPFIYYWQCWINFFPRIFIPTGLVDPSVLIEGVLFRARYLGSTQLVCEGQPTKATRMMQAEEAVSRIKVKSYVEFCRANSFWGGSNGEIMTSSRNPWYGRLFIYLFFLVGSLRLVYIFYYLIEIKLLFEDWYFFKVLVIAILSSLLFEMFRHASWRTFEIFWWQLR